MLYTLKILADNNPVVFNDSYRLFVFRPIRLHVVNGGREYFHFLDTKEEASEFIHGSSDTTRRVVAKSEDRSWVEPLQESRRKILNQLLRQHPVKIDHLDELIDFVYNGIIDPATKSGLSVLAHEYQDESLTALVDIGMTVISSYRSYRENLGVYVDDEFYPTETKEKTTFLTYKQLFDVNPSTEVEHKLKDGSTVTINKDKYDKIIKEVLNYVNVCFKAEKAAKDVLLTYAIKPEELDSIPRDSEDGSLFVKGLKDEYVDASKLAKLYRMVRYAKPPHTTTHSTYKGNKISFLPPETTLELIYEEQFAKIAKEENLINKDNTKYVEAQKKKLDDRKKLRENEERVIDGQES